MSKFKVGDKVRVIGNPQCQTATARNIVGYSGIITRIGCWEQTNQADICTFGKTYYILDNNKDVWENDLKLVGFYNTICYDSGINVGIDFGLIEEIKSYNYKPKQTIMSKITTFAKNLVLSADEKLLRKYGLHDECGNHTDEAEELVMAKLVKENESYLVELATAMQAEEAKN